MGLESTVDEEVKSHSGGAVSREKVAPEAELSNKRSWTIDDSEELYRIQGWGEPYFGINAAGHVTVSPKGDRGD